jgi:hypothetical protein
MPDCPQERRASRWIFRTVAATGPSLDPGAGLRGHYTMASEGPPDGVQIPRKRIGCLALFVRFIVIGTAVYLALLAALAPWNYYLGGHFHWVPGWQGWGRMHSTTAGGDYFMWIRLTPTIPGYRKSPIQGYAYLCTPRGERFHLGLTGSLPKDHGTDLAGVPLQLNMADRPVNWQFVRDHRPHINLYGSFGDSELIMEDRGSLANAFNPDGTVYRQPTQNHHQPENVHVTFKQSTPWAMNPACPPPTAGPIH